MSENTNDGQGQDPGTDEAKTSDKVTFDEAQQAALDRIVASAKQDAANSVWNELGVSKEDVQSLLEDKAKREEEAKSAEERLAEATSQAQSWQDRAAALEGAIQQRLETELSGIPEDKQDLIPDLPPEQKLAWLAKAKDLFVEPTAPTRQTRDDVNDDVNPGDGVGDGSAAMSHHKFARLTIPERVAFYKDHPKLAAKLSREIRDNPSLIHED